MFIILKRYFKYNIEINIIYIILIIHSIWFSLLISKIYLKNNVTIPDILQIIVILLVSGTVLPLNIKVYKKYDKQISIIELIRLNFSKKYRYKILIKDNQYFDNNKLIKYINYIEPVLQLEIFNDIIKLNSGYHLRIEFFKDLNNPCYELIELILKLYIDDFEYINKRCKNYKEYEELYKFMTI